MATAAPAGPHINHYRLRRVASSAEKSCSICYKPTDCVLISTDSKDWFYVCQSHLVAGFATPIAAPAAVAKPDDKAKLEAEIAKVKKEYEAKEAQKKADKEKEEKGGSWMPSVGGLISKAASGVVQAIQPAATPTTMTPPAAVVVPEPKDYGKS
ncbi:AAA-ATPase Vps4-associated protein 1-domain-containing protein [Protomyces lactucae-debilis]|uniref:AAA-ATPase Vps4-associated protein 1-domain-containing protein n=1 Tax=Protomyces lactucae-debilis TaxID=2754530 RepID=A0A1Y2FGH9_PROLT|nr:AAA-ATPase Vps4-associated protein 1-domain-containing protein [Protomyces lactucae-debilis]ORY83050.1 AAA-ATPase Vps4-associated protein 1-domain-containing protein [Protomyces lactucae-debilis]